MDKGRVLLDIDNTREVIGVEILDVAEEPRIILIDRSQGLVDNNEKKE